MKRKNTPIQYALSQNIIFYDGICNLCHWMVCFVKKHDKKGIFSYRPLQEGPQAGSNLRIQADNPVTVLYQKYGQLYDRSDAVLLIAKDLGGAWRWFHYLMIIPKSWRNGIYDIVAGYRYSIFGKTDACTLPKAEPKK